MSGIPYRKLRGRGRRAAGFFTLTAPVSTLWVGSDHLLLVDSYGASEDYRRFYFAEIQAFAVRRTRRLEIGAAVLGTFVLLFGAWASAAGEVARIILGILAAIFVVALAVHALLGPTCRCYVVTRVKREELPALKRTRNARRALDLVRPLIVAAQRDVALAANRARASEAAAAPDPGPPEAPAAVDTREPAAPSEASSP